MSGNRLNPIYVALDSHQYSKAAKLAAALPASNRLGRALLAYAYYKNSQPSNALKVIEEILDWKDVNSEEILDVDEYLEVKPKDVDWTELPKQPCPRDLADETTLDTLSITMSGMRLPGMVYKLYAWVSQHYPTIRPFSQPKQFTAGLQILVQSKGNESILAGMQTLAFQMSRISPSYTAWAAQTALWRWESSNKAENDVQLQMIPRLAESLAKKVVETKGTIEDCLLWVRVLKSQAKWEGIIDILPKLAKLPPLQVLEISLECYTNLEQWDRAEDACINMLRKQSGEQWSSWKTLITCSIKKSGFEETVASVNKLLEDLKTSSRASRTMTLVQCELALVGVQQGLRTAKDLQASIQAYADTFFSIMSCIYADLDIYLKKFIEIADDSEKEALLEWADNIRKSNKLEKDDADRNKLRSLIFSLQVTRKLDPDCLPNWSDIARDWVSFPTTEAIQKENQPSDELILIAVGQLLRGKDAGEKDLQIAATLLEMGLKRSSYNPYLKLGLLNVYNLLGAYDRCWELFRDLGIKHIQVDSCTYFILPALLKGGLYQQAVGVAKEVIKFHISTLSDTSNFASRALENGNWSKADEFLTFQQKRLNNSLTLLQSKGIIMDCAPLLSEKVGLDHGIVGGVDDLERAKKMIDEVHNTTGAPSLVSISEDQEFSDNRDLSILPFGMTAETSDEVRGAAILKKYSHGILIRTVMILNIAKGPKKGKLVKTPEILLKRCKNLLEILEKKKPSTSGWFEVIEILTKVIVLVTSGLPLVDGDSVKNREERATLLVAKASSLVNGINNDQKVGLLVVEYLVPLMAIVKMTAKVYQTFGWGKRKKRESVNTLAGFAAAVKDKLSKMMQSSEFSSDNDEYTMPSIDILEEAVWKDVDGRIELSKDMMKYRLSKILQEFIDELDTFEQNE